MVIQIKMNVKNINKKLNSFHLVTFGFGLAAVVLLLAAMGAPALPSLIQNMSGQVTHSQKVLIGLNTLLATLEDAQSGQRGYLLTQNSLYLERYESARARIGGDIRDAARLTSDNPVQQRRFTALREHAEARMDSLARTLAVFRQNGLEAAMKLIRTGRGDREMQQARQLLTAMRAQERIVLTRYLGRIGATAEQAKIVFAGEFLAIYLLFGGLYILLRRDVRLRLRHAEQEQAENSKTTGILESISDAFIAFDFGWHFIYANHEAERLIGKTRAEMLGGNIWEMFPLAQGSDFDIEYHRVMEERNPRHFETYYAPQERWYEVHVYPSAQGITAYFRDISERVLSDERFRVLFEQSSDAHLLVGANGLIDCNNATVALWGCADKAHVLALHPSVMSPPVQPDGRPSHEKALEMDALAREQGYHRFDWTHRKPDGTDFPVEVTLTPVTLANKPVLLAVLHDLTDRKRAEARAQAQYSVTRILSEADSLEAACQPVLQAVCEGMGWDWGAIWRVQEDANILRCANTWHTPKINADAFLNNTEAMTFAPGTGLPGRVWLRYEPEWIEDVTQDSTFLRADVAMRNNLHAGVAFPIRFEGKVVGVMELLSRETRPEDHDQMQQLNALGSQIGQFMERKRTEAAMHEAKRFADSVAQQSTSLIYVLDLESRTNVYANREVAEALGYTVEQILALGANYMPDFVHPDDLPELMKHFDDFAQMSDADTVEFEARIRHANGEWRWLWFRERVFKRHANGTPYQIMGTAQDITERKRGEQQMQAANEWLEEANEHLSNLANTDGLTGLNNHRAFQERLGVDFERSARYHTPLSLLLLDVDKFKQYNDTYGHPAGDGVLRQVAQILQATARGVDLVARYGGEEFVLILPEADTEGALGAAERVRAAIANAEWPDRPVTVSVGVATMTLNTSTQAALIEQADKALYASKTAGRNRVTHHNALYDLALAVEGMA